MRDARNARRSTLDATRASRIGPAASLKPATEKPSLKTARLRKRLQLVEQLPAADQRTVLKLVEALAEARRSARPRAKARAVG